MKIIIAQTAGFCMGVRRAVDLAIDASNSRPGGIRTVGPLIHNSQTVESLRARGVKELGDETPPSNATIMIRAHGVPPETEMRFRGSGHEIIDGTCPKVKTVHKVIERFRSQGYAIIIAGDEGHAEVIGLMGYAGDAGHLVQGPADVKQLPDFAKVCLVSQTTFDRRTFDEIAEQVRVHYPDAEVLIKKTICSATDRRQSETEQLAKSVDALIVVGGRNSANTTRLVKIAMSSGTPTQHVESEKEIDLPALAGCGTVGITAGASTPHWMIGRVVDYLQSHPGRRTIRSRINKAAEVLVNLNVIVALGAAAVYYASCVFQRVPLQVTHLALGGMISFLYFLSMYLWNSITSIEGTKHFGLGRYEFYHTHKRALVILVAVVMALILGVSWVTGKSLLYLMMFVLAAGTLYHTTIIPSALKKIFPYRSLKDIPVSRDLFVALAWCTLVGFVPHAIRGTFVPTASLVFTLAWVFLFAFLRSVIVDLRDIEGDRIMGRETLVTVLGEKRARTAMKAIIVTAGLAVILCVALSRAVPLLSDASLWAAQAPVALYMFWFVRHSRIHRIAHPAVFAVLVDVQFLLMGLCAFVAQHTIVD